MGTARRLECHHVNTLTERLAGAAIIFDRVISEMLEADEMGGVRDDADYISLMRRIAAECDSRIQTVISNRQAVEHPG